MKDLNEVSWMNLEPKKQQLQGCIFLIGDGAKRKPII